MTREQAPDATPARLVTDTRLDSLGLHASIVAGLNARGFTQATPIQADTLPLALAGRDIAGQANTGTRDGFILLLLQLGNAAKWMR